MSAFPVRCRVVGLGMSVMPSSGGGGGRAVVYMPGAGGAFNLQAQPGYVGNNPSNPMARPMNAFEMYNPAAAMQQRQQQEVIAAQRQPPVAQSLPVIIPRRPEDMPQREQVMYIHQPPPPRIVQPPPVVQPPVVIQPPVVVQPPVVQPPTEVTPNTAQTPVAEAPKKSDATAAVVGISAAGLLAALLFR
jgi:hypothetical protein